MTGRSELQVTNTNATVVAYDSNQSDIIFTCVEKSADASTVDKLCTFKDNLGYVYGIR